MQGGEEVTSQPTWSQKQEIELQIVVIIIYILSKYHFRGFN
jgi:hypothetical protein